MKNLILALVVSLISSAAFADIPPPPYLEARNLSGGNLEFVYSLMSAGETKVSETTDEHQRKVVTYRKIQRSGFRLQERYENGTKRALICNREDTPGFSGHHFNAYSCRSIEAYKIALPESDADLLKVEPRQETTPSSPSEN